MKQILIFLLLSLSGKSFASRSVTFPITPQPTENWLALSYCPNGPCGAMQPGYTTGAPIYQGVVVPGKLYAASALRLECHVVNTSSFSQDIIISAEKNSQVEYSFNISGNGGTTAPLNTFVTTLGAGESYDFIYRTGGPPAGFPGSPSTVSPVGSVYIPGIPRTVTIATSGANADRGALMGQCVMSVESFVLNGAAFSNSSIPINGGRPF